MSNLVQKIPQIVSVSPLKLTSPTEKRLDRKMTIFPPQKSKTVLLPRTFPACAPSSIMSNKTAEAGNCGSTPEEAGLSSWPPSTAIPVKLWRSPGALLDDAHALPVAVIPSCSSPQSTARQPEVKRMVDVSTQSVAPSRSDESAAKATSDAVLVMKKTQNGRTIFSTQGVPGSSTRPSQYLVTRASGSSTQASVVTSVAAFRPNIISTLPDSGMVRVAVNPSKPGLSGTRIVFPKGSNVGVPVTKLQNFTNDGSSLATREMGHMTSSSMQGKHPPAVVHVSSVPGRNTVKNLLETRCTAPQPNASNAPPSNQSVVSVVSVKPSNCGASVLRKEQCDTTPSVAQTQASQDQQDESYGIKIVNVCSLAREHKGQALSKHVSQVAVGNDGGNTNKPMTSSNTREACQEKDGSPKKAPELKETLVSRCNLHAGENQQEGGIIELCSFQTKKGNSVIGSQIVFKPAPSSGHASTNATPCSKSDKLKEAIKLFEESMLQDTDLFSEGEKNILSSLFHRVKNDTVTAESEVGDKRQDKLPLFPSKLARKAEPSPPDQRVGDSVFNAQQDKRLENLSSHRQSKPLQHPGKVTIKAEPISPDKPAGDSVPNVRQNENLATQIAKGEHNATASHRPLRRIVITSDEVPVIGSDQVKTGIEAFLVQNNISNNFSQDEVIKLHWDGKDVSTFHFRDADSNRSPSPHPPPDVLVPRKIKPNILRCNKPATPATSAGSEASGAATITALAGRQTGSGTTPPKVDTLPEQPKASTSGPTMLAGYKAIRVKCVADSHQVVLTPLGPMSATKGCISAEKQLCFMPRAIRYIKKTGEVIEQPLKPGQQQVVPVVAPNGTKAAPLHQKSAICMTSPAVPVISSASFRHVLPGVQTTSKSFPLQLQTTKPMPTVAETLSVPVRASRIVNVNTEPKSQSPEASFPERLGSSVSMPQAPLQKPMYPAMCDDDAARILEPEVLLEVSNRIIEVDPPEKTQLDASSSSSNSSSESCSSEDWRVCSKDWAPPVQAHKKSGLARKRACPKSSVQREYRTRKRRRQGKKQNSPAQPPPAKPSKTSSDETNVAILSSNCIDRPCVVNMYHLNDRLMTKGFVNLASVKHKELFALARTPEVRLAPDKVVSVVQLNPDQTTLAQEVAVTHVSESVSREIETDSLESLLKEQINHLVQLRKKYKQSSQ